MSVNILPFILSITLNTASCFPIDLNTIDPGSSQWTTWTPILAVGFLVVSIVSLAACVCCQRNKGFQEFTDCNSSNSLSNAGGFANSVSPTSEFTIFPPLQSSLATPGNRLSVVQFEPLPDIKPPQVQPHTKRPAAFNSVVNNGLSTHDWFEDPRSNFPRHQLKYVRELGRGWFGRVIEGEAQGIIPGQNSSRVIVKSLHDDATPTDQIYFLHEVKPYRDLNHPNILRLLGRCLETDPFLIIFESCAGGDLKSFLTTNIATANALNEQGTTLKMACDIVSGLEHMIDKGFVHTDLATRNCLVTPDLTVKIGDYGTGIETFKEDYYCTGDIALPIRWCAPETLDCTDTTIETKEVTACANVWSLGVVLWEICEFGKLPYADLTDDEVIIKVLGEGTRRLDMPSLPCSYRHSLYLLMKQCWSPSSQRPELSQVRLMLVHLLTSKQRHLRDGDSLSLNDEDDFERRWQTFKPNTIPKMDNHIVSDISTSQSCIDDSRPPSLFCDSNTNLVHHTSDEGVADLQSLTNYNTDVSNTPHTASPQPSLSSSTGGDFFLSAVHNRHKSPSLQNLRGSVDDLSESADVPSSTPIKKEQTGDNESRNSEIEVHKQEELSLTEQASEHDFDSWLKGVETTNEEDARFVKKISEAIRDLDNALALEKTSSSSESSNDSYMHSSPSKNIPDSNQNVVLDFRLGKVESGAITERFSELTFEADSLQDDSFLDINRKCSQQDVKCTDSGTDTEDEMWRKRIEQGEFSKKVKEKSKSVADLMILTHIECSDGSDSDTPSLTWTFERDNILRGSVTKQRCGISLKNSALNSNTGAIFGSESNIHGAVLGEDFKDTLQKLQAAQKQGKANNIKYEVSTTNKDSFTDNLNTSVNVSVLPSSNVEPTNHDRQIDFLENDASEKLQNEGEILVPINVCAENTKSGRCNFVSFENSTTSLPDMNDKQSPCNEEACKLSKQFNRISADILLAEKVSETTENDSVYLELKLNKSLNDVENNKVGKLDEKCNIDSSELCLDKPDKVPLYTSTPQHNHAKQHTPFLNHELSNIIDTTCINSTNEDVSEITPSCLESEESELIRVEFKLPKNDIVNENDHEDITGSVTNEYEHDVLSEKLENFKNCNYFAPAFSSGFYFSTPGKNDINTEDSGPHSVILGPCEDYTLDYFKGLKTTFDDENKVLANKVELEYQKSEVPKFNEKLENHKQQQEQNNVYEGDFSIDSWNKHLDEVCNERLAEMTFGAISFEHTPSFEESAVYLLDNNIAVEEKEMCKCNNILINDALRCDGEVLTDEKPSLPSYSIGSLNDKEIFNNEMDTNENDSLLVPSFKFIAPTPSHSGRNTPDSVHCGVSDDVFLFDDSKNVDGTPLNGKDTNCDKTCVPVDNAENLDTCKSVECTVTDSEQIDENCKTADNHHTIPIPPAFISVKGKLETCDSSSTEDSAFDFPRSDEISVSSNSKETSRHELTNLDLVESYPEKSESSVSKWQQDQRSMLSENLLRSVLKEEDFPMPFNMNECETVGSSDDEFGLDAAKRSTPDDERSSDSGFRDKGSLSESCEDACDEKYNLEDIEAELEETYQREGFNYAEDQENDNHNNHVSSNDMYFDGVYVNARMNEDLHYEDHNADSLEESHVPVDDVPDHASEMYKQHGIVSGDSKSVATASGWFLHPQTAKVNGINSPNESLVDSSEKEQRHKKECKDSEDISSEDSYMSFSLDEEFVNAIRNELREKLPYIRQHSKEEEEQEEETENIEEEIADLEEDDDKKDDRMDITIQYTSYPTPLSPILEESESMSSSINENYPFFLSNLNVFDSDPSSPLFVLKPVESQQDDKYLKTNTNKFEDEIKDALENCSFSSNDTENSSMKEEKKSCIVVEDLEELSSSPFDVQKSKVVIIRGTNSSPMEDVLLVDTETNKATLLESPTPKSHLAFICNKKPEVMEESLSLTIDDLDETMTTGVNSETFAIKSNKFDISNSEDHIINRHSNSDVFTPDSISPEQRSSETTEYTQSSGSAAFTPNTEDLSAVLTSSVPSSEDSLQSDATTDFLTKFQLNTFHTSLLPDNVSSKPTYDPVEKMSSNNEAEEIIGELKETGIIKTYEASETLKSETSSECDTAEAVSVESPFHSVQNKVSDSSDSFHSLNKDEKKESGDESLTDTSVSNNADNFLVDQDSLEEDSVDCQSEDKSDKEPPFDEKDWSIPSLEASLLSTKAPMPSPEEESWKKIPSMLAFSDLDDVMNRHIQDNHFTEIDDVSSPEGAYRDADDADLMSTSFSTKDDDGEEQGECYTPDWESETEDTNDDDNNSSSSGEFVWKEGEREESIRAVGATSSSSSTYKNYDGLTDFPMEAITEEDEEDDDDCSTCSESSTEFVPSAWNSEAIPNRSALRSPDKKSEQKKSVSFKKQKYHCVYEYPRELSDSDSEGQDILAQYNWNLYEPQVDYASYADWELMDGDIPESAITEIDNDPENTKTQIPEQFDIYKLSSVDYDFTNVLSGDNEFYISSSSRPFQFMNGGGGGPAQFYPNDLYDTSNTTDIEDVTVDIVSEPEASEVLTVPNDCEKQCLEQSELNLNSEIDSSVPLPSGQDSGVSEDLPVKVPDLSDNNEVIKVNCMKEPITETVLNGDLTPPISPTGLGELRHTRDRLKLDLRTKTTSFTLDSPIAEKRRAVESVKGEASVLDSGEDTEDSGIESSNGATSSRTLVHMLQCKESVT